MLSYVTLEAIAPVPGAERPLTRTAIRNVIINSSIFVTRGRRSLAMPRLLFPKPAKSADQPTIGTQVPYKVPLVVSDLAQTSRVKVCIDMVSLLVVKL
jgi:hypothetical protein